MSSASRDPGVSSGVFSFLFDRFVLDEGQVALFEGKTASNIERLPFEVLACLLRRAPAAVPASELAEQLWPDGATPNTVSKAIDRVRKTLGDKSLIETVPKAAGRPSAYRVARHVTVERISRSDPRHPRSVGSLPGAPQKSIRDFFNAVVAAAKSGRVKADSTVELLRGTSDMWLNEYQNDPLALARIRIDLSAAFLDVSDMGGAIAELRRAVDALEPLVPADDLLLLIARFSLVSLLALASQLDEASALLSVAESCAPPAALAANPELALAACSAQFCHLLMRRDMPGAIQAGRRLVELADTQPGTLIRRHGARSRLAEALYLGGRLDEAAKILNDSLASPFGREQVGEYRHAIACLQLARVYVGLGKLEGMEEVIIEARDTLERCGGPKEVFVGTANVELGVLYSKLGRPSDAIVAFERAYESMTLRYRNPDHQSLRIVQLNIAVARLDEGDYAGALRVLDRERPGFEADLQGPHNAIVEIIDFHRARALTALSRPQQALQLLTHVHPECLNEAEPAVYWAGWLEAERACAHLGAGGGAAAVEALERAVRILRSMHAPAWLQLRYGGVLQRLAGREAAR